MRRTSVNGDNYRAGTLIGCHLFFWCSETYECVNRKCVLDATDYSYVNFFLHLLTNLTLKGVMTKNITCAHYSYSLRRFGHRADKTIWQPYTPKKLCA